jgi:hypothetical protein
MAVSIPGPDQMTTQVAAAALHEFDVGTQVSEDDLRANGVNIPKLGRSRAYRLIYWRGPPVENPDTGELEPGDILTGGAWDGEFTKNVSCGWTPLPQYGQFDDPGGMWMPSKDKFRRILRHPLGPKEFTLRQIMEMCNGDLRKLPKGVEFPQLKTPEGQAAIAARRRCNFCGAWRKNDRDLAAHQRVRHSEDANIDTQARKQAELLGGALKESSAQTSGVADKIADAITALAERQEAADKKFAQLIESLPSLIAAAAGGAPKGK